MPYQLIHGDEYRSFVLTGQETDISEESKTALLSFASCGACGAQRENIGRCDCPNPCAELKFHVAHASLIEPLLRLDSNRFDAREKQQIRRERMRDCAGFHTQEDCPRILRLQDNRCYFCGSSFLVSYERDHLTPISRGGSDWPSNIALVCKSCNSSKHDKDEREFWNWLSERNGTEWMKCRKEAVSEQRAKKRALTTSNKKKLKDLAESFERRLQATIAAARKCIDVNVTAHDQGFAIAVGDLEIGLLPHSHRRIERWLEAEPLEKIALALVALERALR